ncbi:hypothetical protein [Pelagibius sp. Alg239-R121]|uniref:hypothetical protein n=1 Tax=Pelagibius sp. Alg239-R121 TaxID=2993448 RepID=UPI0024A6EFA1|nr:hypothetical protein [Pelagibius sp. Alg239-R121]
MKESAAGSVLVFASLGHALFHGLVALFLTLVLVLEAIWQGPSDELLGPWTRGAFASLIAQLVLTRRRVLSLVLHSGGPGDPGVLGCAISAVGSLLERCSSGCLTEKLS